MLVIQSVQSPYLLNSLSKQIQFDVKDSLIFIQSLNNFLSSFAIILIIIKIIFYIIVYSNELIEVFFVNMNVLLTKPFYR